jgi:hypothetical protein
VLLQKDNKLRIQAWRTIFYYYIYITIEYIGEGKSPKAISSLGKMVSFRAIARFQGERYKSREVHLPRLGMS